LSDALESVRQQTARDSIAEIIVSENSTNDESKEICSRFPDLPIVYVQQKPPVSPLLHAKIIMEVAKSPIIALLHDDDWWAPGHIESALRVLKDNTKCAAVFSNIYETNGPTFPTDRIPEKQWLVWMSSGCDFGPPALILDQISVFMSCLLDAAFHYSTVVARNHAMRQAFGEVHASNNGYDNDRTFPIFLSHHGSIGYLTVPDTYILLHSNQDSARASNLSEGWSLKSRTTKWLLQKYPLQVAQAVKLFNSVNTTLRATSEPWLVSQFTDYLGEPHRTTLRQECGFNLPPKKKYKWLIKQLCPPAFLALRQRISALLKK
jgi:glycosyltransferase involved in cell wall biosynthesis